MTNESSQQAVMWWDGVADPLREYRHTGPVEPKAPTTLANVTPPRDLLTKLDPAPRVSCGAEH
jgi:hypothetical protein